MKIESEELVIHERLIKRAKAIGLDIEDGMVRRSSSRFCLGIEHGDYNGMELFGIGTDRFIWLAYKPNTLGRVRIFSENFSEDGIVEVCLDRSPKLAEVSQSWSRFPHGVSDTLRRSGYDLDTGFDAVLLGNIPGGGMSRSASLTLNLLETFLEVNGVQSLDGMDMVNLSQRVENEYIGSPCGKLDQIMIYFAKEGLGTFFDPITEKVEHVPFGGDIEAFRIVSLDTGTKRPGLEKSTYKKRRRECDGLNRFLRKSLGMSIAEIATLEDYENALKSLNDYKLPGQKRLKYLYESRERFQNTIRLWREGSIQKIGQNFRADGWGLRDDYEISGRELETMCDIARTVEGVYGERMLGGGDKGAAGAIVHKDAFPDLKAAVQRAYPLCHPDFADSFAVHACKSVDGITCHPLTVL